MNRQVRSKVIQFSIDKDDKTLWCDAKLTLINYRNPYRDKIIVDELEFHSVTNKDDSYIPLTDEDRNELSAVLSEKLSDFNEIMK